MKRFRHTDFRNAVSENNKRQSAFHADDGDAWYAALEISAKNARKVNFVLYKIPVKN